MNKKIHNFDLWNEYLDNKGNILKGKFLFCLKDTTTPIEIYDKDGTPIDNPILTDIHGRTNIQVFLPDEVEVTVYVYKYIGNGILEQDVTNKEELWELQYTINLVNPGIEVEVKDATRCPTIEALKNASKELEYITLIGYNEPYDTEPVNYYWDSESIEEPDEGSIIAKNGVQKGRWKLVTPCYKLCSTHFGIFPSNSINNNPDQTLKIKKFIDYCNEHGLHPLFDGNKDYRYYNIKDIDLIWHNDVFVNEYTQFIVEGKVNLYGEIQGSTTQLFYKTISARVKVSCKEGYTAWCSELDCSNAVHFNGQYAYPTRWSGITCYIEEDISGQVFDQCNMVASKRIQGENTFKNMEVKEIWFTDDSEWQNIEDTCILDLSDWPTTSKWIHYRNEWNNGEYGDLQGRTIDDDIIQEEYVSASNFTSTGNVKAPLVSLSNAVVNSIEADTLVVKDTTIENDFELSKNIEAAHCVLKSVTALNASVFDSTIEELTASNIKIVNSTLTNLKSSITLEMKSCNVSNILEQKGADTTIYDSIVNQLQVYARTKTNLTLKNNTVNFCFIGLRTEGEPDCIMNCVITDNVFKTKLGVYHSNFDSDDRKHSYTYKHNSEPVSNQSIYLWATQNIVNYQDDKAFVVAVLNADTNSWNTALYFHYKSFVPLPIFAIGTKNVKSVTFRLSILEDYQNDFRYSRVIGGNMSTPICVRNITTISDDFTIRGSGIELECQGNIGYSDEKGYYWIPTQVNFLTNEFQPTYNFSALQIHDSTVTELQVNAVYTYLESIAEHPLKYKIEVLD